MSTAKTILSAERYARAAAFTPPKLGTRLSGMIGDGYWIDDRRYFFCVTEIDADGRQANLPRIADAASGTVAPVLATDVLAALISDHSGKDVAPADLAAAQYDMPDPGTLVVMLAADTYHVAIDGPTLVKAGTLDPAMALHSPDGMHACILKDHAIWAKDRAAGTASQLTPDGERHHGYGEIPESATMPVSIRKMSMPCGLWSADSEWFATHRIDERHLPESGLVENAPAEGRRAIPHVFKVAGPDHELPALEFVAFHLPSGRSVSSAGRPLIVQAFSPFFYRGAWFAGDSLYFFDWDRFSSAVALVAMNLDTGEVATILSETVETGWIDVHPMIIGQPMVRPLHGSGELIWYSQRDGRGHLYLHDLTSGALKNRITEGTWMVREIVHVDEAGRRILFLASGFDDASDLGQRRLCAIDFDGNGFETLLAIDGDVAIKSDPVSGVDQLKPFRPSHARSGVSSDGRHVVASLGRADMATRTVLIEIATGRQVELATLDIDAHWAAPKPRPFEALAADGVTRLFGAMYVPSDFDETASYPLVDYIYPGPQLNWYTRRFPNGMAVMLQSVVELGMVGIILETRGMPNRDRAFHQAGQGRMLEPQLSDHVAVIEQLCQRHAFLDRDRVGIFGQSGGGHATARALFDYPDVFKAGVSVCGNHDNRNYIAHWIDKYGGRPGTPERDTQSNAAVAHQLQGKLFLIHGDMDENVHPGHTLAVSAALIAAGKDFDQLIVPGAGHGVLGESPYVLQRLWNFFARHLLGAEPPADFKLDYTPGEAVAGMRMILADIS